jgi:hypothetical protein
VRLRFAVPRVCARKWKQNLLSGILEEVQEQKDFLRRQGAQFNAEAHISTQPPPPREDTRLQGAHEDELRRRRAQPSPGRGPQAGLRKRRPS